MDEYKYKILRRDLKCKIEYCVPTVYIVVYVYYLYSTTNVKYVIEFNGICIY